MSVRVDCVYTKPARTKVRTFGKTDTTKKLRHKKYTSIWVIYKTAKKSMQKMKKYIYWKKREQLPFYESTADCYRATKKSLPT